MNGARVTTAANRRIHVGNVLTKPGAWEMTARLRRFLSAVPDGQPVRERQSPRMLDTSLAAASTLAEEPPSVGAVAVLEPGAYYDAIPYGDPRFGKVLAAWLLPRLAAALSPIQRHVLARIAVHTWTHDEEIPFYAPNFHQLAAALDLVEHNLVWWEEQFTPERRLAFGLTLPGAWIVQRVCHVVPALLTVRQEIEFDRMRLLMRNEWETEDDGIDATPAPTSPTPKRTRRLRLVK